MVGKEEDRRSYSLPSASGDHVPAHRSPTPFQCRGCEPLLVLLGPRGAFTEPRRPLTFSWSLEGTPDRPLCRPMRCPSHAAPSFENVKGVTEIHLRAEGPRVVIPVRARRAKARERLPSYRDLASRNPQTEPALTFLIVSAFSRTVSPSLRSCPASGGLRASFWLAPCFSNKPCDFPENKTRDASDRLLPPERFTCTRTSCVPSSLRDFHRVDTPRSLGLRAVDRGTECFTTLENASADRRWTRAAILPLRFGAPFPVRELRAWAFSSHGAS